MRPRQSSLGIRERVVPFPTLECLASMRPRQSSLGIFNAASLVACETGASMRPRQSSLGISRPRSQRWCRRGPRFNEAEAIKPRNPEPSSTARPVAWASMRPRQSSLGISPADRNFLAVGRHAASMRPRQSSLGISCRPARTPSCARRFNEAEAIKPRNPRYTS